MGLRCVLIVEDETPLRAALARVLARRAPEVVEAATLADGLARLADASPDLVVFDVRLPDGSGVRLAEAAARLRPKPTLVAISGEATNAEVFTLAQAGVARFVAKPFTVESLLRTLDTARRWVPELEPLVAESVGKRELLDVVSTVRGTMVEEALAKAEGSRRGAAKQLGVSRQAVQQIVRKRDAADAAPELPAPNGRRAPHPTP
jgi:ActR/RegA family two-component response regulator